MKSLSMMIQLIVALGLLNVWLIRFRKATPYRGGNASSMIDEFKVYGLPEWMVYVVGGLKISIAFALIGAIWLPFLVFPSAGLLAFLMLSAVFMHFKVSDPIVRAVPAMSMLAMSLFLFIHAGWLA